MVESIENHNNTQNGGGKRGNGCLWLLAVLLFFSLAGNVMFVLTGVMTDLRTHELGVINRDVQVPLTDKELFLRETVEGAYLLLEHGSKYAPPLRRSNLKETLQTNVSRLRGGGAELSFWKGGLLWALIMDAQRRNDTDALQRVEEVFKHQMITDTVYFADKAMHGFAAVQLWKATDRNEYKKYADRMYAEVKRHDTDFGILYFDDSDAQYVDATGMVTPFLAVYGKELGCDEAYQLALKQINLYARYGTDSETGIPSHGYETREPHVKMGSSGWARGAAWYALGSAFLNDTDLDSIAQQRIAMFQNTMLSLYKRDGKFGQFVGDSKNIDLSATLPMLFYFKQKGLYNPSKQELLSYSAYLHDGLLYNSSGDTLAFNRYNEFMGPNPLAQAMIILLLCM